MWTGGGCPPAVVATPAAAPAARSLRLPHACFRPPPPRRREPVVEGGANGLLFRSPLAQRPWEALHLCSPRGRRPLASSRRLWARRAAAALGSGSPMWWRDAGAAALVMGGAYALVLCFDVLAGRGLVDQKLSRKIVHVLSGVLFMSSWPLFSSSIEARFFAALTPFVNCLRLTIYGLSLVTDDGLIKSVTREGKPEELLRGPLYYVLVLMFCVMVFWRDSPVGIIALSMMSGGDGIADIMGRKFGGEKLPYNNRKSWVGSICMFTSGFFISMGMLSYFSSLGYFDFDWLASAKKVAVVSLTATLVESLPITDVLDDNISVPLSSMLMASLLFGSEML